MHSSSGISLLTFILEPHTPATRRWRALLDVGWNNCICTDRQLHGCRRVPHGESPRTKSSPFAWTRMYPASHRPQGRNELPAASLSFAVRACIFGSPGHCSVTTAMQRTGWRPLRLLRSKRWNRTWQGILRPEAAIHRNFARRSPAWKRGRELTIPQPSQTVLSPGAQPSPQTCQPRCRRRFRGE